MLRWILWTLIIIWLLSKLKDWFGNSSQSQNTTHNNTSHSQNQSTTEQSDNSKKLKDNAGEYVDYEDMK